MATTLREDSRWSTSTTKARNPKKPSTKSGKHDGFNNILPEVLSNDDFDSLVKQVQNFDGDKLAKAYDYSLALADRDRELDKQNGILGFEDSDLNRKTRADKYFEEFQDRMGLTGDYRTTGAKIRGESPLGTFVGALRGGLNTINNGLGAGIDWGIDRFGDLAGAVSGNEELAEKIRNATTGEDIAPWISLAEDLGIMAAAPMTALPILAGKGLLEHSDDIQEAISGVDSVTGEELSGSQRGMKGLSAGIGTALTALPGASSLKAGKKLIADDLAAQLAKAEEGTAKAGEALALREGETNAANDILKAKRAAGREGREAYDEAAKASEQRYNELQRLLGKNKNLVFDNPEDARSIQKAIEANQKQIEALEKELGPIEDLDGLTRQELIDRIEKQQGIDRWFYTRPGSNRPQEFGPTSKVRLVEDPDHPMGAYIVPNESRLTELGYAQTTKPVIEGVPPTGNWYPSPLTPGLPKFKLGDYKLVRKRSSTSGEREALRKNKEIIESTNKGLETARKEQDRLADLLSRYEQLTGSTAIGEGTTAADLLATGSVSDAAAAKRLAEEQLREVGIAGRKDTGKFDQAVNDLEKKVRNAKIVENNSRRALREAQQAESAAKRGSKAIEDYVGRRTAGLNPFSGIGKWARGEDLIGTNMWANQLAREAMGRQVAAAGGYGAAMKNILKGKPIGGDAAKKAATAEAEETAENVAESAVEEVAEEAAKKGGLGKVLGRFKKGGKAAEESAETAIRGPGMVAGIPLTWGGILAQAGADSPGGVKGAMEEISRAINEGDYGAMLPWILATLPAGRKTPIAKRFARVTGGSTTPYMAMKGSLGMDAASNFLNGDNYTIEDEEELSNIIKALQTGGK